MIRKLWPLALAVCPLVLSACADTVFEDHDQRASAPFFFVHRERPTVGESYLADEEDVFRPMQDLNLAERNDREAMAAGLAPEPRLPAGCGFRDRFDRDGALAYNFDGGRKRLALHMDMGNVGLGGVEVDQMMVQFKYKLQDPPKRHKDGCRYDSHFQGLVGSAYNEMFMRRNDTVWDELRDRNLTGIFD